MVESIVGLLVMALGGGFFCSLIGLAWKGERGAVIGFVLGVVLTPVLLMAFFVLLIRTGIFATPG
jgi:hypothetical protein